MKVWMDLTVPLLLTLISCGQFVVGQFDPPYNTANYPNPRTNPSACGQSAPSYVCNANNLISASDADTLNQIMGDTYDITKGQGCEDIANSPNEGFREALAIVPRIQDTAGFNAQQHRFIANNFAADLRSAWRFGSCENDVVVIYVPSANTIGLSTGTRALKRLPAEYSTNLIDDTLTRINRNNAGEELKKLMEKFKESLTLWSWQRVFTFLWAFILAVVAVALIIIVIVVCVRCRKRPEAEKAKQEEELADEEEAPCCWCCRCGGQEDEEERIEKLFKAPDTEENGQDDDTPVIIPQWAREKTEEEDTKRREKTQKKSQRKSFKEEKSVTVVENKAAPREKNLKERKAKKKEANLSQKGEKRKRTTLIIEVGGPEDQVEEKIVEKKQKQEEIQDLGTPSKVVFRSSNTSSSTIKLCPAPKNTPPMNPMTDVQPILIPLDPYMMNGSAFTPTPAPNTSPYGPVIRTVPQQPYLPVYTPAPYQQTQTDSWNYTGSRNTTTVPMPDDQSSIVTVNDNLGKCMIVIGLDEQGDAPIIPRGSEGVSVNLSDYQGEYGSAAVAIFPGNDNPVPKLDNNSGPLTVVSVNEDLSRAERHEGNIDKADSICHKTSEARKKNYKEESSDESSRSEDSENESDATESSNVTSSSGSSEVSGKSGKSSEKSNSSGTSSDSEKSEQAHQGKSGRQRKQEEKQRKAFAKQEEEFKKKMKEKSSRRKSEPTPSTASSEKNSGKAKEKSKRSSKHSVKSSDQNGDRQNLGRATKWSSKGGFNKKGDLDYF